MAQGNIPPAFGFSREFQPVKDVRAGGEERTYRRPREQHGVHSVKVPSSLATHRHTTVKEPLLQATACFYSSFGTLNSRVHRESGSQLNLSIPKHTSFHKWSKNFHRGDSLETKTRQSNSQSLEYLAEPQPSAQSSESEPYIARVHPAPVYKESSVKLTSEEIARLFVKTTTNFVSGIDHGRSVKLTEVRLRTLFTV